MDLKNCKAELEREDGVKIYRTPGQRFLPVHPDGRHLADVPTTQEAMLAADVNRIRPEPKPQQRQAPATLQSRYRPVKRRRTG